MNNFNVLFGIVFLLFSCAKEEPTTTIHKYETSGRINTTIKEIKEDIAYGDASRHVFDAYLPKKRDSISTKAIILVPGGGWIGGDKLGFQFQADLMADLSIAAFVINYRYAEVDRGVTYIEMLEDIDMAIEYIISKSDEFQFNPKEISLFGHSAGGHLSLLYSYRNNSRGRIKNVISVSGVSDITDEKLLTMPNTGIKPIFDILVGTDEIEKWQDASPINHVNNMTTYLYHGKKDEIIPYEQSVVLFNKIESLNPNNKLVLFDNGTHGLDIPTFTTIINETVNYVKK